jgi:hypothetical protein
MCPSEFGVADLSHLLDRLEASQNPDAKTRSPFKKRGRFQRTMRELAVATRAISHLH